MKQALEHNGDLLAEEPEDHLVLGLPALLGIFFAVALVCALCFGFGYSRGHGWGLGRFASAPAGPKPSGAPDTAVAARPAAIPAKPAPGTSVQDPESTEAGEVPSMPPAQELPRTGAAVRDETAAPSSLTPRTAPPGATLMVQIAAVSRAADAETLARALKRNGFTPVVRTSSADSFFHVQVGPFATLASAKAMRARLTDSGYNAFVKP